MGVVVVALPMWNAVKTKAARALKDAVSLACVKAKCYN